MPLKQKPASLADETRNSIFEFSSFGVNEPDIETITGVPNGTISKLISSAKAFACNFRFAGLFTAIRVEKALIKKATGYETTEITKIYIPDSADGVYDENKLKIKESRIVTKFVPPDTSAAYHYLCNIRGSRWSKSPAAAEEKESYEDFLKKNLADQKEITENM